MKLAAIATLVLATLLSPALNAQRAYNVQQERKSSILLLFGSGNSLLANVSINYGQPLWKPEYDEQFDAMNGRSLRLGKDWWTTLVTATPLMFGKKKIDVGVHYLGLETAKDGKISLVFFDVAEATKKGMVPWSAANWKGGTKIPLEMTKNVSEDVVDRMVISMAQDAEDPKAGRFSVRWGTHELSAAVGFGKKKR